ncbi:MAG: c-type cytochrome [Actinomycetota bacterium]
MITRGLGVLCYVGALGLSACSYFSGDQTQPSRAPLPQEQTADVGERLYQRDCAWCHGNEGGGTSNGPDLLTAQNGPALTDFMLRTGRMPLTHPEQSTDHGDSLYDEEEIAALVEYVTSLDDDPGPAIPTPQPEAADRALGGELYFENCAACHSATAVGGTLTSEQAEDTADPVLTGSDLVSPGLGEATAVEIAEAIVGGPGNMPAFGDETLSPSQRDAVVSYVLYMQDPNDRGGAPIGRIGPVVEGAVAWIIGLGLLVLAVRWIGTKADDT